MVEQVLPYAAAFLPMNDQISLLSVSKIFHNLCIAQFGCLVLPSYLSKDGGEYLAESEFKLPPAPNTNYIAPEKCLAPQCRFYGTEQNKGFCSVCVLGNNPSEETLMAWKEKREKSTAIQHEFDFTEWKKEIVRRQELFRRVQLLKEFLCKLKTLHSVIIERIAEKVFPLSLEIIQENFGSSLRCLYLPHMCIDNDILFMISNSFKQLRHLDISQPKRTAKNINDESVLSLCRLPKLEHLIISNCITDPITFVEKMPEMRNLKALSLAGNYTSALPFEAKVISGYVAKCPNLEALDLRDTFGVLNDMCMLADLKHLCFLDLRDFFYSFEKKVYYGTPSRSWALKIPSLQALVLPHELESYVSDDEFNPDLQIYVEEVKQPVMQNFLPCPDCAVNTRDFPFKPHPRKGRMDPRARRMEDYDFD